MKRWICAAALFALAGCSAVPSVPTHLQTQGVAMKASGGAFSGAYAGYYVGGSCNTRFGFTGSGSASFIHASTESGSMGPSLGMSCLFNGSVTIKNNFRPSNSITIVLGQSGLPCSSRTRILGIPFTVASGTGRFINATGSGKVRFTCGSGISRTYTDQWSGTITF